jgi:hypothetical protein
VPLTLTAVLVVLMLHGGFRPPVGRLFSWPMYAWTTTAVVRVEVRDDPDAPLVPVNPFRELPRGEFSIPPDVLDQYLDHLRERHAEVVCTGHLYGSFGEVGIQAGGPRVAAAES